MTDKEFMETWVCDRESPEECMHCIDWNEEEGHCNIQALQGNQEFTDSLE